jgi:hypothetical protein
MDSYCSLEQLARLPQHLLMNRNRRIPEAVALLAGDVAEPARDIGADQASVAAKQDPLPTDPR